MKIPIHVNLSPDWVAVLRRHGWDAVHWSAVGDPKATDRTIMEWSAANGYVLFTHDLDFGTMLAATQAPKPSVIQVRTEDVLPGHLAPLLEGVLTEHRTAIEAGALVVVEESRSRVRILPLSW